MNHWSFEYRITMEDPGGTNSFIEDLPSEHVKTADEIWKIADKIAADRDLKVIGIIKRVYVSVEVPRPGIEPVAVPLPPVGNSQQNDHPRYG